jgi:hypothetical protein
MIAWSAARSRHPSALAPHSASPVTAASKGLWGASSPAYFQVDELLRQLANSNLHDIPCDLPFRVEWDRSDQHLRWVISASASVAVAHAAMHAAIANNPDQRFTLRNGIQIIRGNPRD